MLIVPNKVSYGFTDNLRILYRIELAIYMLLKYNSGYRIAYNKPPKHTL
jgi:hypothetical protein